jgi:hypothetical protein
MGKPATAMSFAWAGKSRVHFPVRKKVAGTFLLCSVLRIDATASALAPASKLSATTGAVVGMRSQSTPSTDGGGAGGPAGDYACAQSDHAPLRTRRDLSALSVPRTTRSTLPAEPAATGA